MAKFGAGYALLIGVGETAYPTWSLPTTVGDAKALRSILVDEDRCGYVDDEKHIRLLSGNTARRDSIGAGLHWLANCADDDPDATVVIYYSGHGWVDKETGSYYLIPHDADPLGLQQSALSGEEFTDLLRQIKCQRLLVILDCCHAAGQAEAKEVVRPTGFTTGAVPGPVAAAIAGEGRAVLSSSREHQSSWVRKDGRLSVFTFHLLEALLGAANRPGEQTVKLSNIMNHVGRAVPATAASEYGAEQVPYFEMAAEDFAVALVLGGKGLPSGGWEEIRGDAHRQLHEAERALTLTVNVSDTASVHNINVIGEMRDLHIGDRGD